MKCEFCDGIGIIKRPTTKSSVCKSCFFNSFEEEIHNTIKRFNLFKDGSHIVLAVSGGKDSIVLASVMNTLKRKYEYNVRFSILSIDEGISGYRDDSLNVVRLNQVQLGWPLLILSYSDLFSGWTMDKVVHKVGLRNNCTYCGVFRRQALDYGAIDFKADHLFTGHNADDVAETVLMNILRGDLNRLEQSSNITTKNETISQSMNLNFARSKPFKYVSEKEIVLYAYFKKLNYFSTECIYAPGAYRGYARKFLKNLERFRSKAIFDILLSSEYLLLNDDAKSHNKSITVSKCSNCEYYSNKHLCKACLFINILKQ